MVAIIPGLTTDHFSRENYGSRRSRSDYYSKKNAPKLTKAKVYRDGSSFYFSWNVEATYGEEVFYLQATGNILDSRSSRGYDAPKWWGFECRCSCQEFQEQERKTMGSNFMINYVCQHLESALESSLDDQTSSGVIETLLVPPEYHNKDDMEETLPSLTEERKFRTSHPISTYNVVGKSSSLSSSSSCCYRKKESSLKIPGLTELHFTNDSIRLKCETQPAISRVEIDHGQGDFDVEWVVNGNDGLVYDLRASGNIISLEKPIATPHWWGFTVSCDCPDFQRQRRRCRVSRWTQNFVCQHIGTALENAIISYREEEDDKEDKQQKVLSTYATFLV